jgi:hypothetical protein
MSDFVDNIWNDTGKKSNMSDPRTVHVKSDFVNFDLRAPAGQSSILPSPAQRHQPLMRRMQRFQDDSCELTTKPDASLREVI